MTGTSIVARARRWLAERDGGAPLVIVAGSVEAGSALVAAEAASRGAVAGWERTTLDGLARRVSAPLRAARGLRFTSAVGREALVLDLTTRAAAAGSLGRFTPLAGRPGLSRSLARVLGELREADASAAEVERVEPALGALLRALDAELRARSLLDRPRLFALATEALTTQSSSDVPPVLALDVPVASRVEADFLRALVARSPSARVIVRSWDRRTLALLAEDLGAALEIDGEDTGLGAVATRLFGELGATAPSSVAADVRTFSAATEHEECLEIAARIQDLAEGGARYGSIAVLLRDPATYRAALEGALERAGIPFFSARGARRPDPSGRALLALLDCALDGLSARAFAEYLSFSVIPPDALGEPRPAQRRGDLFGDDDEESDGLEAPAEDAGDEGAVRAGTLRAPRHFEQLLTDAAVIGGEARWERRLRGLRASFERSLAELDDPESAAAQRLRADVADLDALTGFALPLVHDLAALPRTASLGEHCDQIAALASRALARPRRALAVLSELARSGGGARSLEEVRGLLAPLLSDVTSDVVRASGAVSVLAIDEARGRSFDVVFVPGLADGAFPRRLVEDAVLRDDARRSISADLPTREARAEDERARLRLAVSSAERVLVASHPRIDAERSRPRVPSLYLLELVRAATGTLPRASEAAPPAARGTLGAPSDPRRAVDASEHDVAHVAELLARSSRGEPVPKGSARYLVVDGSAAGRTLRRSLEERWRRNERRFERQFTVSDGELGEGAAKAVLLRHAPGARVLSASALESFVACPYRFFLGAVLRLRGREVREPLVELDPLLRGSIVHDLAYRWLVQMRDAGHFASDARTERGRAVLADVMSEARGRLHEELVPALPRVFDDELDRIEKDLARWAAELSADWQPAYFELGFGRPGGTAHDAASVDAPVALPEVGLTLRGSIDLVERRALAGAGPELRATDLKTGRPAHAPGMRIGGGRALQPILYALALEKLVPDGKVSGGRLHYATTRGGFSEVVVPLDDEARAAMKRVVDALDAEVRSGRMIRWPEPKTCTYCDFLAVCGEGEERRADVKRRHVSLPLLDAVRREP